MSEKQFRIFMFVVIGALIGTIIAGIAKADVSMPVKWDQALFYEDGSVLDPKDLSGFELHYSVDEDFEENDAPLRINSSERSFEFTLSLEPRLEPYAVQLGVKAVTIYGTKSEMSNLVTSMFKVNSTKKPVKPVNVRISISCDETCEIIDSVVEEQ